MSGGTSTREVRHTRPVLESLEDRQLLSQAGIDATGNVNNLSTQSQATATAAAQRRFAYTTASGERVVLSLYGAGNLNGTHYNPATDAVDIRFAETNAQTGLVGKVYGGNGQANLESLIHANLPPDSISGVGSSLIRVINLKNFNLIPGGRVNLTGGVQTFLLNSTAPNTQISLRDIPASVLNPSTSSTSANDNGVTLGFAVDLFGAQTLTSTSGQFLPGANLLPTAIPTKPGPPPAPAGVVAVINHVDGLARQAGIGSPNLYGYDPTTDSLVRFTIQYNSTTKTFSGSPTVVRTNVLGKTGVEAGVSFGRYNGSLTLLVSDGTTMYGFNAEDGTPVGKPVSLAGLAASGMVNPTRLGNIDSFTVIGDPTSGNPSSTIPTKLGLIQIIDVTTSLNTGTITPVGVPFASSRDFGQAGGMTSIPGSSILFTTGGAHFDPYQPDAFQLGISSLTPTGTAGSLASATFKESGRNALTNKGTTIPSDPHGATTTSKNDALASINLNLALVTGLGTDPTTGAPANTVSLFNPTSFAKTGTISLDYANLLSGITSVYYPQLQGSALVDIQGNVQSFRANDTLGMVLNDTGNLNLAKINTAVDTTILGAPFGHAEIPHRQNVLILSTPRSVGDRNGVVQVPSGVLPVGPLRLP